jgi:GT2 family glycosyltransferase
MAGLTLTGGAGRPSRDPILSVSVVTYNSRHCLPAFLASLQQQREVSWELFFFDNASRDGTSELIRQESMGELTVSKENLGYGRAHNRNVVRQRGAYLLFLNPDLEFGPDLFGALVRHLEQHPEHGLAGPRILEGNLRQEFPPRRFYPGEGMVALQPGLRRDTIAWVSGCCLLVRSNVFQKLGGFDEDYFLYQEDTDFCLRARLAGYKIGYVNDTVVHHLHRQSQRELSEYEYRRRIFEGSALFWGKHYPPRDVIRMVRFQYWVTGMLLALAPITRWLPLGAAFADARLQARKDVCRSWLKKCGYGRIGISSIPGRILLRQCRIVVEWIRQGRFPLDDY